MPRTNAERRRPRWITAVVALGLVVASLAPLVGLAADLTLREFGDSFLLTAVTVASAGTLVAGAILSRHPRHPVGWLMLVAALVSPIAVVSFEWVLLIDDAVLVSDLALGSELTLWFGLTGWAFVDLPFVLLTPLFFPDGRLPSRRWRPLLAVVASWVAVTGCAYAVATSPFGLPTDVTVDAWIGGGAAGLVTSGATAARIADAALTAYPVLAIASISSMVVRWRRADTLERLQLRWALAGVGVGVPLAAVGVSLMSGGDDQLATLGVLALTLGFLAVPTSMGIAIVRHQLFDLDRLVSRTLTYVLLSVLLGAIFLGAVVGLSALVQGGIGTDPPTWTIAVSTVLAYSLFAPLRRRVQTAIDRRLHRRIVDAEQIMASLSGAFEDNVDLGRLTGVIDDAVARTLAPTTVAVWLPDARLDTALPTDPRGIRSDTFTAWTPEPSARPAHRPA